MAAPFEVRRFETGEAEALRLLCEQVHHLVWSESSAYVISAHEAELVGAGAGENGGEHTAAALQGK